MPEDREPNAPDMPHADTHTPLHGPTGGVPSDKALSDTREAETILSLESYYYRYDFFQRKTQFLLALACQCACPNVACGPV
eukprot:scaffold7956_cov124-Isochrysis_galbana.AAC.1